MGSEGPRAGGSLPHLNDDANESVADTSQSSGVEIQHLPDSGEGGEESSDSTDVVSVESKESSKKKPCFSSNGLGWVVIQLTEAAEFSSVVDVERDLRRIIDKGAEYFYFPAISRAGTFLRDHPYANYVFLSTPQSDSKILKLEGSRFVDTVLCVPGSAGRWRTVIRLTDTELNGSCSEQDMEEIPIGVDVKVISGEWLGLEGILLHVFGNQVKVSLQLRSRRRILILARNDIERL